jgi:hypothetical protein
LEKRAQYVVDRVFQQRLAMSLMVIVSLVLAVLLLGFCIAVAYALILSPGMADMPLTLGLVGQLLRQLWWLLLVLAAVCLALSYGIIFYYTHRIAGPVYRFRRLFDELAEGRVHTQVQLRKGDSFENLAGSVLRANATLASSIAELKTAVAALSKKGKAPGDRDLKKQIAVIKHVLDRYHVVVAEKKADAARATTRRGRITALEK